MKRESQFQNFLSSEILSPEMKIILQAIRINQTSDYWGWKIDREEINWPYITELGIWHGVLPLVYKFLKKQKKGLVPEEELNKQKTLYLKKVGRNIQLTQKLLNILRILSTHGYEAVPLKGPALAVKAYGGIDSRDFCDLDILIKTRDFPSIYNLMESQGYISGKPKIGKMKTVWKKSRRNFEVHDKNSIIDFHQQITQGPRFLSSMERWDSHNSVELNNQPVPSLALHDTIMMLCLHGTHHGWNLLKMVADLAHLVHSNRNDIDCDVLVKKARGMGSLRILMIGILLSHIFCGLKIPPKIRYLIQLDEKSRKLTRHFSHEILEMKQYQRLPPFAVPRSLDSFFYQFKYMIYYLFNPTNLDLLAFRLPSFLYPIYFFIRPLRLGFNIVKEVLDKN